MANISAKDVQALREKTGAGMMDCKKALVEAEGDVDKAIEVLRERGLAAATKKAGRIAAEGVVCSYFDEAAKIGVLVEVNSETDFVAKNDKFQGLVKGVAETVAKENPADVETLKDTKFAGSDRTVAETFQEAVLSIGENMNIRRFERVEGICATYIHMGGAVGVLVNFNVDDDTAAKAEFKEMGKNVAMQIAAMKPEYLSDSDISAEELEKMRNITVQSALNTPDSLPKPILTSIINKAIAAKRWADADVAAYEEQKNNKFLFNFLSKEAIAVLAEIAVADQNEYAANPIFGKLVDGRIAKQLKETCLLKQEFVRGDLFEGNVEGYVASVAKALGANVKVKSFFRYERGEGLQKREDDFAAEVASMMK